MTRIDKDGNLMTMAESIAADKKAAQDAKKQEEKKKKK